MEKAEREPTATEASDVPLLPHPLRKNKVHESCMCVCACVCVCVKVLQYYSVRELCVRELCVSKLFARRLCVSKLSVCVCVCVCGRVVCDGVVFE